MKKKELGKGIRALLSNMDKVETVDQEQLVKVLSSSAAEIPLSNIEINPFQPRTAFNEEALNDLAQSIKMHGLIQPITVRRLSSKHYQIISGERRVRASKIAGLRSLPAFIRIADDQQMLELALIENIQREDLNAVEIAISYKRLMDECDLTQEQLGLHVGKNRSTISNYIRLLKLPPVVQQAIKSADLSMGHARALLAINNAEIQLEVFHKILEQGLSVRQTEELIRRMNDKISGKNRVIPTIPEDVQNFLIGFNEKLKRTSVIKQNKAGNGTLQIPFSSASDLKSLIEKLKVKE